MQLVAVRQAIESGLPTIGALVERDPIVLKATVTIEIQNMIDFLNIGKVMNDSQVAQTIEMILVCYPDLNLADIKLFFQKLKRGDFGKVYDRMDGNVILDAMEVYNQEKISELEGIHNERKHQSLGGMHPRVIEVMNSAINDYRKKKAEEDALRPKEVREKSHAEIFIQRCHRQFDNLFRGNEVSGRSYALRSGIRAIKIGTEVFTIDKFIERKVKNAIDKI